MRGISRAGLLAVVALLALTGVGAGVAADRPVLWKLLGIAWVAFLAMAGAVPLGVRAASRARARPLAWGYGLASGAMVTSAAVFLVPDAVGHHARLGGFGVAAGILLGFGAHVVGHRLTHREPFDRTAVELTAHALAAGVVIGVVYGNLPELGPLLGVAIVSHKGPAGYAAARRLATDGRRASVLLVPACGVGLTAIPAGLVALPAVPAVNAVVFGFAAGVFLHVGMDFLPECEVGGEVHAAALRGGHGSDGDRERGDHYDHGRDSGSNHDHDHGHGPADNHRHGHGGHHGDGADGEAAVHDRLDRLRLHAVAATVLGGFVVFLAWAAVSL